MRISRRKIQIFMAGAEMNIKKIAERIAMKPQNLSTILSRGTCRPETAVRIANALGVAVTEILAEEE